MIVICPDASRLHALTLYPVPVFAAGVTSIRQAILFVAHLVIPADLALPKEVPTQTL